MTKEGTERDPRSIESEKREAKRLEEYRKKFIVVGDELEIVKILSGKYVPLEDILTYLAESEYFYGEEWYVDEGGVVLDYYKVVEDYGHYLNEKKLAGE